MAKKAGGEPAGVKRQQNSYTERHIDFDCAEYRFRAESLTTRQNSSKAPYRAVLVIPNAPIVTAATLWKGKPPPEHQH